MQLRDNLSYQDSKTERMAMDMLTGLIDTTNTQDYTFNYLKNDLSLYFYPLCLAKKNPQDITQTEYQYRLGEDMNNREANSFPNDYSIPRTYNIPTVGLISVFNIGGQQLLARLNLKGGPSVY